MSNNNLKKPELLQLIADNAGHGATPESANRYLESFKKTILDQLKLNGEIYIYGFGTFSVAKQGGLMIDGMNNIATGEKESRWIGANLRLNFIPSQPMKDAINGDFEVIKKKSRPRKYNKNSEKLEALKTKRRAQKEYKTPEQIFAEMRNRASKGNGNGEKGND